MASDAPVSQAYASALANRRIQSGQVITENGIEGPLLLLRDVPRVEAKSVIDPGAEVGTANVVVNVSKEPGSPVVSGRAEIDNYGNRVSGTTRVGAEVNVNNPYGFGDQLSLRGIRAIRAKEGGNNFGRIGYSVLAGAYGTRLGASAARLGYELGGEFSAIRPNGVANVFSASIGQPLIRTKDNNLFVELVAEHKKLTDRVEVPVSVEERSLTSARVQLNGDVLDTLAGLNVYTVSVSRGRLRIDDPVRLGFDQDAVSGAHTTGDFTKVLYSFERLQQIARGLHGKLGVSGQLANKNLHSAEKFALGGESTVRAFPVGELVGDQGYTATAELRWLIPPLQSARLSVVNTVFYDYGRVRVNHDNSLLKDPNNTRHISGAGLGMNIGYADRVMLRMAVGWPRDQQSNNAVKRGTRAWGQLSFRF